MWRKKEEKVERNPKNTERAMKWTRVSCAKYHVKF
jgi:hypothetical protein